MLFSRAFDEFADLHRRDPKRAEAVFNWLVGNLGTAESLHAKRLVAVSPERVMQGDSLDEATKQIAQREFQKTLLLRFAEPFSDDEVPDKYKTIMPAVRDLNAENGCSDPHVPLVRRVRRGYLLKRFASLCGPCYDDFNYLQARRFDDRVVEGSDLLVFGGPWLAVDSVKKTMDEQKDLLAKLAKRFKLPFKLIHGSVALAAIVIQSHEQLTKNNLPQDNKWVRTNTLESGGGRLFLRWRDVGRLCCGGWGWGDVGGRHGGLGCLALGVVALGR